jgi:PUB domain
MDNSKGDETLAALKTIRTLIANAVDPEQDDKKKKVRVSNPKIQKNIFQVEGCLEIMELTCFVYGVEVFQEWLIFEPEQLRAPWALVSALQQSIKDLEISSTASTSKATNRTSKAMQRTSLHPEMERRLVGSQSQLNTQMET